jgi:arsenite methyltransferase
MRLLGNVPAEIKRNVELWAGCVAGALSDEDYISKLTVAGFKHISIDPTRVYSLDDARTFLSAQGVNVDEIAQQVAGKFISAFVRANKPADSRSSPSCS